MSAQLKVQLKLKEVLQQRNMSGRELSRRTEIRPRTIHDMMANRTKDMPLASIAKICQELGIEITDLMELVPEEQ